MAQEDTGLKVTTVHRPSRCTGILGLGTDEQSISISCQLPRHRGRHEHVIDDAEGHRQVVIRWEDDKLPEAE